MNWPASRYRGSVLWSLLRRNRDYRTVLIAQIISFAGDWFATVAFAGLVLDRTNSDLLATTVFVVSALPAFLVTPFAGPVADRFDRKRIMVICSIIQGFAALGFLLSQRHWIGFGFIAQGGIAAVGAFFGPASQAAIVNLVDPDDLATATAASSSVWGAMLAIGSGLGALVAARFGRAVAFELNAASFIVAGAFIATVRGKTSQRATGAARQRMRPIADSIEAARYARSNRHIKAFLLSKAGFGFGTGVVGLLAVLAKRRFDTGDGGTGVLLFARGMGVLMGPWFVRFAYRRGLPGVVACCGVGAIVYGVGYLFVSWATAIGFAAVAAFVAHLGGGAQWSSVIFGIAKTAPDEVRGRIGAADFALVTLSMSISLALAGVASSRWGPAATIRALAIVQLSWGALFLYLTRELRHESTVVVPGN
jgi:predicted MFS family arabinose efflux permease